MRKLLLATSVAMLLSINCYASGPDAANIYLEHSLQIAFQQQTNSTNTNMIIYGGQDISRPIIATANEELWKGSFGYVG